MTIQLKNIKKVHLLEGCRKGSKEKERGKEGRNNVIIN